MNARRILIALITIVLISSLFVGAISARETAAPTITTLNNVRDYAAATSSDGISYAVDAGVLYAGGPVSWSALKTPATVIVSAVATDSANENLLYIGAANEMAIYRSENAGQSWTRLPLSNEIIGGVTDIAVDSFQRLVFVGTDNGGVFRLRDVGSSLVLNSHLLLDEPVVQIATDSTGAGLAFIRTTWNLYRTENFGLSWVQVDNLGSAPTAVAIANTQPATVYVGTVDRGLLKSNNGMDWTLANEGLGLNPGTRLQIDALTIDPAQPDVLYVATSYNFGTTTVHNTPLSVSTSNNGGSEWTVLESNLDATVASLLPVPGVDNGVYALTTTSRTPLALGNAPTVADEVVNATPAEQTNWFGTVRGLIAWVVAGLAAIALAFAIAADLRSRKPTQGGTLAPRTAHHGR